MLWIPGPTEVRPEILAECARPMIGHRGKAMAALMESLDPGLKLAFGLDDASRAHVAVHTTSATGLMESALKGVGPRVLCVVNGAFAKRWFDIAGLLGKTARALTIRWGDAVRPEALDRALTDGGPFDAVTLVSNETSTGVRTPLADVARVLRGHPEVLLLVDLVSYIAGAPVDFDQNGIDFGFAGVQKAFALPPGISVLCASQRFLDSARAQKLRGFYLDPVKIVEGHELRATPCTPCIPLYFALARQLADIGGQRAAWRARFDEHARMQSRTASWARSHGLDLLPSPEHASPTISCIRAGNLDVIALIAGLKERGHEIGNGYGDLKGKTFRIGHMGDHTDARLAEMLALADEVIAAMVPAR
jgi:aspartate aminotransferase-like enzyme